MHATAALAEALVLSLTAEGIEGAGQLSRLRNWYASLGKVTISRSHSRKQR